MPSKKKLNLKTWSIVGPLKIALHAPTITQHSNCTAMPTSTLQQQPPKGGLQWYSWGKLWWPVVIVDTGDNDCVVDPGSRKLVMEVSTMDTQGMESSVTEPTAQSKGLYWFKSTIFHVPGRMRVRFTCVTDDIVQELIEDIEVTHNPDVVVAEVKSPLNTTAKPSSAVSSQSQEGAVKKTGKSGGGGGTGSNKRKPSAVTSVDDVGKRKRSNAVPTALDGSVHIASLLPYPRIVNLDSKTRLEIPFPLLSANGTSTTSTTSTTSAAPAERHPHPQQQTAYPEFVDVEGPVLRARLPVSLVQALARDRESLVPQMCAFHQQQQQRQQQQQQQTATTTSSSSNSGLKQQQQQQHGEEAVSEEDFNLSQYWSRDELLPENVARPSVAELLQMLQQRCCSGGGTATTAAAAAGNRSSSSRSSTTTTSSSSKAATLTKVQAREVCARLGTYFEYFLEDHILFPEERTACRLVLRRMRDARRPVALQLGAYHFLRLLVLLVTVAQPPASSGSSDSSGDSSGGGGGTDPPAVPSTAGGDADADADATGAQLRTSRRAAAAVASAAITSTTSGSSSSSSSSSGSGTASADVANSSREPAEDTSAGAGAGASSGTGRRVAKPKKLGEDADEEQAAAAGGGGGGGELLAQTLQQLQVVVDEALSMLHEQAHILFY